MTREEIFDALLDIVGEIAPDEDWSQLGRDESLRGKLESMDFLDVVMEIRKRYGVDVPESDYGQLGTLNSCVDYLEPKLKDK
ncbi:MAG: acyl carrier protein [Victivallales bacterium]|nr:acyl carrier protein [Victivallales bacterium]